MRRRGYKILLVAMASCFSQPCTSCGSQSATSQSSGCQTTGLGGGGCQPITETYPDVRVPPPYDTDAGTLYDANAADGSGDDASSLAYVGSPLCGIPVSGSSCNPDQQPSPDAGSAFASCVAQTMPADAGDEDAGDVDATAATDAGIDAEVHDGGAPADARPSDAGDVVLACRVVPASLQDAGGGAAVVPACALPGPGQDGQPCARGTDCAPTFDCVGDAGHGTCRRYCCDNQCADARADGGADAAEGGQVAFCDIQALAAYPGTAIPVCVQAAPCTLFQPCPDASQTCSVVSSQGATACISAGSQGQGQSCEQGHCQAGLICSGTFPQRTCAQLCDNGDNECSGSQYCEVDPVLPPNVGLCVGP